MGKLMHAFAAAFALLLAGCSVAVPSNETSGSPLKVSPGQGGAHLTGPVALDFVFNLTAPVPPTPAGADHNCVDLDADVPMLLNATATWDPQTPLAQRLTLRAFDQAGNEASTTSESPARVDFAGNGTKRVTVGIFVPGEAGAVQQAVHLHVEAFLMDAPGETAVQIRAGEYSCQGSGSPIARRCPESRRRPIVAVKASSRGAVRNPPPRHLAPGGGNEPGLQPRIAGWRPGTGGPWGLPIIAHRGPRKHHGAVFAPRG